MRRGAVKRCLLRGGMRTAPGSIRCKSYYPAPARQNLRQRHGRPRSPAPWPERMVGPAGLPRRFARHRRMAHPCHDLVHDFGQFRRDQRDHCQEHHAERGEYGIHAPHCRQAFVLAHVRSDKNGVRLRCVQCAVRCDSFASGQHSQALSKAKQNN